MPAPSADPIRLQKILSQHGVCSRRIAEQMIRDGRITLNGQPAQLGDRATPTDTITVDGEVLQQGKPQPKILMAWHKPQGVECTLKPHPKYTTLADYHWGQHRLYNVGRLDRDSRGLLFMTNDGELAHRLTHPRYQHPKEYLVTYQQPHHPEQISRMAAGLTLDDGTRTRPCQVEVIAPRVVRITLTEGRNRQLRRMAAAVGLQVIDLIRIRIGRTQLGQLPEGTGRILGQTELQSVRQLVDLD